MNHIVKDNLIDLNSKLTDENQRLSLLVYSLQRQLEKAAVQINYAQSLEERLESVSFELIQLRRDNQILQEQLYLVSQSSISMDKEQTFQQEIENVKIQYEQKLQVLLKENKRLNRINKELQNKQINNLETQAQKLMELSVELKNKLDSFGQQSSSLNSSIMAPKVLTKQIYDNLIQQLSQSSGEEKTFRTTQPKRLPVLQIKETKQQNNNSQKIFAAIPFISNNNSVK
ncbi:unnamed protein product [Paramecium primaurelia]|uniref:Uncharacterized protein n=1 Tax=Paramecium primaurelia TaxID=5886 RepID=A0A8S1P1U7_PARPR|nr:unnamed protein product [Paramecium primaurelia]